MERIGIFGGTFNPPHIGHIRAAQQAIDTLGLDRLVLMPNLSAPHKQAMHAVSAEHRLAMLRLAASALPQAEVSDLELRQGGISYTYLTVQKMKERYPDSQLVLLIGSDKLSGFDGWKNADIIAQNALIGVLFRGDKGEKEAVESKKAELEKRGIRVELVNNAVTSISSSQLRRLVAFDCAEPFLPEGIADYIRVHKLYDSCADFKNLPMEQLEPIVVRLLKSNRVAHVLGCRDTAVKLAEHWGADCTDAARAGILHDITKALDGPLQLTLCDEYGTMLDEFSQKYPKTLHALTGSLVAERIFGENREVVEAIRHHTTGKANMSLLEKIIYVADYMEPNRTLPYVDRLRQLAYSDLDGALKLGLEMTLEHLAVLGDEVSPATQSALDYLNQK